MSLTYTCNICSFLNTNMNYSNTHKLFYMTVIVNIVSKRILAMLRFSTRRRNWPLMMAIRWMTEKRKQITIVIRGVMNVNET